MVPIEDEQTGACSTARPQASFEQQPVLHWNTHVQPQSPDDLRWLWQLWRANTTNPSYPAGYTQPERMPDQRATGTFATHDLLTAMPMVPGEERSAGPQLDWSWWPLEGVEMTANIPTQPEPTLMPDQRTPNAFATNELYNALPTATGEESRPSPPLDWSWWPLEGVETAASMTTPSWNVSHAQTEAMHMPDQRTPDAFAINDLLNALQISFEGEASSRVRTDWPWLAREGID